MWTSDVQKMSDEELFDATIGYLSTRLSVSGQMIAELNEAKERLKIMRKCCEVAVRYDKLKYTHGRLSRSFINAEQDFEESLNAYRQMRAKQNA
jgi:hypothetical protein